MKEVLEKEEVIMTIGGFMERKELLKKLNELKRSVVAISLASNVIL